MLRAVHEGLWAERVPYKIKGITIGRQLIAVRLPSGGWWILSPIPVTAELRAGLANLGPVEHVIAPNIVHDECLEAFQREYPAALFHAAPGLAAAKKTVRFDRELTEASDPACWLNIGSPACRSSTNLSFFTAQAGRSSSLISLSTWASTNPG